MRLSSDKPYELRAEEWGVGTMNREHGSRVIEHGTWVNPIKFGGGRNRPPPPSDSKTGVLNAKKIQCLALADLDLKEEENTNCSWE